MYWGRLFLFPLFTWKHRLRIDLLKPATKIKIQESGDKGVKLGSVKNQLHLEHVSGSISLSSR